MAWTASIVSFTVPLGHVKVSVEIIHQPINICMHKEIKRNHPCQHASIRGTITLSSSIHENRTVVVLLQPYYYPSLSKNPAPPARIFAMKVSYHLVIALIWTYDSGVIIPPLAKLERKLNKCLTIFSARTVGSLKSEFERAMDEDNEASSAWIVVKGSTAMPKIAVASAAEFGFG